MLTWKQKRSWNGMARTCPRALSCSKNVNCFFFGRAVVSKFWEGKKKSSLRLPLRLLFPKHVTSSLRLFLRKKKNQRAQISHHHHGNGRGARSEESERHHPNGQSSGTTGKEEERCRDGNFGEEESAEQTRRRCVFDFFLFGDLSLKASPRGPIGFLFLFVFLSLFLSLSFRARTTKVMRTRCACLNAWCRAFDVALRKERERERVLSRRFALPRRKKNRFQAAPFFSLFFSLLTFSDLLFFILLLLLLIRRRSGERR